MAKNTKSTAKKADTKPVVAEVKSAAKAAEVKEEVKAEVKEEVKAEVKEEVKAEAKKEAAKKIATVKKETVKKSETESVVYVQFAGNEASTADVLAKAKAAYVAEGHKESTIKDIKLYIKPEEFAAYYVINDKASGRVDLF